MASTSSSVNASLPTSWWARAVLVGGLVAFVLLVLGAIGTKLTIWKYTVGLLMFLGGFVLAAIGAVTGLIALIIARKHERRADRMTALFGTVMCGAVLGITLAYAVPGLKVPPIHDITTDIADPPMFSDVAMQARASAENKVQRDGKLDAAQRAGYPDLHSITSALSPAEALTLAVAVVNKLEWQVINAKPEAGLLEATATTRWFGFKDDVVVRIRANTGAPGSVVDLRSVSRVGVGDAGANAKRIRAFVTEFTSGANPR